MGTIYYNNLYQIEDDYRKNKYYTLVVLSLKNDLNKWKQKINANGNILYFSPEYNGEQFRVEVFTNGVEFVHICHSKPPITNRDSELISNNFPKELSSLIKNLRETIYTDEIASLEKLISGNGRKEKLDFLDIDQINEQIEDTYKDWQKNSTEIPAKFIAKLIYSYRRKEEKYNLWIEKFGENELIMEELKKLKGV